MDKILKPNRLDIDPNSPNAAKAWKHWKLTFQNFIDQCQKQSKLPVLINHISSEVFEYIEECKDYDSAIKMLDGIYVKVPNEIFSRHLLATRRQQSGETLEEYLQELRRLSKNCNFEAVSAEKYKEEMVRDAFINGLMSNTIRQRLLENKTLDLNTAFDQACCLDRAQRNCEAYSSVPLASVTRSNVHSDNPQSQSLDQDQDTKEMTESRVAATRSFKRNCFFCGGSPHDRKRCPARDAFCNLCSKKGHFAKVCMSAKNSSSAAAFITPSTATLCTTSLPGLQGAITTVTINDENVTTPQALVALIDTGSSDSFINERIAKSLNLLILPSNKKISMAQSSLITHVKGRCLVPITFKGRVYPSVALYVIDGLCTDVILGQDFQSQHKSLLIKYDGSYPTLKIDKTDAVCSLSTASVEEPSLFNNLRPGCKPIAAKSRYFNKEDREFIATEIRRLLDEGIIELSSSPWRAQVVVVKDDLNRRKKRLCVDYSQTINTFIISTPY